jgi:hypothetical protein
MATKILKGKMWKIETTMEKDSKVPIVLSHRMVETNDEKEAVPIVLLSEKRRCPACNSNVCLHPGTFLTDPFKDENIEYVLCLCVRHKKEFILQRRIFQTDNIENIKKCYFCGSKFIAINETTSCEEYIDITCMQCSQSYVLCKR